MLDWLGQGWDPIVTGKLVASTLVVAGVMVARALALRAIHRTQEPEFSYRAHKGLTYTAVVLIGFSLTWIWVDAFDNFATYVGFVSAGIAIGLSDLLKNIVGWAYLLIRRPFKIGDRIEVSGHKGDVVDVRLFRFSMLEIGGDLIGAEQSSGRLLHVPNGIVFTETIANYTEGFKYVWHEVAVLVTFESDWRAARTMLESAIDDQEVEAVARSGAELRETARRYNIKIGSLSPIVYMTVRDSGVLLTGRFLVDPRARRATDEAVWTAVLDGFSAAANIHLAYPTVRNVVDIHSGSPELS